MSQIIEGSIVEHATREGRLVVKMVCGKKAAVVDELGELSTENLEDLYLIPGQDYNVLRRVVVDSMDKLTREIGRGNINSARYQLALSRALYDADVRCGEDNITLLQNKISVCITDTLSEEAVKNILSSTLSSDISIVARPAMKPGSEIPTLEHTDITGHSETLVQALTDDELAEMCCDIADMLSTFGGFAASTTARKANYNAMSELQRRLTVWDSPSSNLRKNQTWTLAKQVVAHCRKAEVQDAIDGVLEAIASKDDEDEDF